ncbi:unnamed protein product [Caenorhabditis sp. 36 PRJEB53466]|nr:unnamed protein product [Caenorhabditis sp. 36 PRJEB53466]
MFAPNVSRAAFMFQLVQWLPSMSVECPNPPSSWALAFDGPISFAVIFGGILGNLYSLKQLFSRSINTSMLVSLTGLAIWDIVLLIGALWHHSLWATMHYFSLRDEPWDAQMVASNGLVECGHVTSMLETSLMRNIFYKVLYRGIFLSIVKTFGPFLVITCLTISTLKSMRKSMNSRASILIAQGQNHLFQADKDKTKSLQYISIMLLGKFLFLRCFPTAWATIQMFYGSDSSHFLPVYLSQFCLLLNSATNSFVFVVVKSAFETRRLKRIRQRHRELVAQHAEQVLSIGKALAGDKLLLIPDPEFENQSSEEEAFEMQPMMPSSTSNPV